MYATPSFPRLGRNQRWRNPIACRGQLFYRSPEPASNSNGLMTHKPPALTDFRRIVVKVGSSLLIDAAAGCVKQGWLASLVADVARLHAEGRELLVVSS